MLFKEDMLNNVLYIARSARIRTQVLFKLRLLFFYLFFKEQIRFNTHSH